MPLFSKKENITVKPGNSCLFMMFAGFNFVLFLSSLGILGCSIYLFIKVGEGNVFDITFLCLSLFLMILTLISFKLRESTHLMCCYIFFLFLLFTFMLIFSLVLMFNKSTVKDMAHKAFAKCTNC